MIPALRALLTTEESHAQLLAHRGWRQTSALMWFLAPGLACASTAETRLLKGRVGSKGHESKKTGCDCDQSMLVNIAFGSPLVSQLPETVKFPSTPRTVAKGGFSKLGAMKDIR